MNREEVMQERYGEYDTPAEMNAQNPIGTSPYYQPILMSSEKADLFDKIRPEDSVETIRYLFMGYEFDKAENKWNFNPLYKNVALTKLGAWQLTTLIFPVSNKSVTISKLKDLDIRERVKSLIRTSMKMCLRNWKEYGIRGAEQLFFIKEIILSVAFITLKQPEDAGARIFIQGTTQENRIVQETPRKEGAISGIFRR